MSSRERIVVWNDSDTESPMSFVGYLVMFCDKTSPILKSTALIVYHFLVGSISCSAKYTRWLSENGQTVVSFQPVQADSDLKDS